MWQSNQKNSSCMPWILYTNERIHITSRYSISRHIHNTYASRVIEEREANTILGFPPPQVDPSEEWRPRSDRVNLCRLRCGHHLDADRTWAGLKSYRFQIWLETDDLCHSQMSWGIRHSHTVAHVIEECPAQRSHPRMWIQECESFSLRLNEQW